MSSELHDLKDGRFQIQRQIGEGAYGIVYQAYDRVREHLVALKTLHLLSADALFHFKNEFRGLAGLSHPNLVTLYELLSDGKHWFFTMELVDGVDFLDHLRRSGRRGTEGTPRQDGRGPLSGDFDLLRNLLKQLARGIAALHEAGKLHRDIKPTNVLVTADARVVLLDFGLLADAPAGSAHQSQHIVGTPAYMAPEQAARRPVSAASDWYSFGVMLYQALCGKLPFDGEEHSILLDKQRVAPSAVNSLVANLPEDLIGLAADLLSIRPEARPGGTEVLRRLETLPARRGRGAYQPLSKETEFIGRGLELLQLEEAYALTQHGHPAAVYVHGVSGLGKTALVRHFLARLREREAGEVVVLEGRCYERESVPYKALDSLVDSLSLYLRALPSHEAESFLPRDLFALTRLFPVLKRVESVAAGRRRFTDIRDPGELRRRAARALRDLLARLAAQRPLVLFIDDLQWGDEESGALIGELLLPPDPPALLLVACSRSDAALATQMQARLGDAAEPGGYREIALAEMSRDIARELAVTLAKQDGTVSGARAEAIAAEAGGNPFFINELVRFSREGEMDGKAPAAGEMPAVNESQAVRESAAAGAADLLSHFIRTRVGRLSAPARRLLETIAVAGRPVELAVAQSAAAVGGAFHAALDELRAGHLLSGRGNRAHDPLETFHDRIRVSVVDGLGPESFRQHHERLALAFEASERADPETLADLFLGAEMFERASEYAETAGSRAAEALAFDRAARLYRVAVDLRGAGEPGVQSLRVRLADALAFAGRGADAAKAYQSAAKGTRGAESLELRRRAAEQLLRSGRIGEGLLAIGEILPAMGLRLARSPRMALAKLLLHRGRLAFSKLAFRERLASDLRAADLIRIDTCWTVATGLGLVDTLRGAEFQAHHLILALEAGEPLRVARAFACEIGYSATGGSHSIGRTSKLVRLGRRAAEASGAPEALGLITAAEGLAAFLEGRWQPARRLGESAEVILREKCRGVAWELDTAHLYILKSLELTGELREFSRLLLRVTKEARDRGDRFALASLRARFGSLARLIEDDVAGAANLTATALEGWPQETFHLQHSWKLFAQVEIDLHVGSPRAALARLDERWSGLERSFLLRVQGSRVLAFEARCRAAIATAADCAIDGSERGRYLRAAARDLRRIEAERLPWGAALAALARAGIAATRGRREEAPALLAAAEAGFDDTAMGLHAKVARWRRGELILGDQGAELRREAKEWMRGQGIKNPAVFVARIAPGHYIG